MIISAVRLRLKDITRSNKWNKRAIKIRSARTCASGSACATRATREQSVCSTVVPARETLFALSCAPSDRRPLPLPSLARRDVMRRAEERPCRGDPPRRLRPTHTCNVPEIMNAEGSAQMRLCTEQVWLSIPVGTMQTTLMMRGCHMPLPEGI